MITAVSTISLVHQAALGDTLLLLPLIGSLRQRFAGCAITLVTRTDVGQMLTMRGFVDGHASADDREHTLWFAPPSGQWPVVSGQRPGDDAQGLSASEQPAQPNSFPAWAKADLLICAVAGAGDAWAANARLARPGTAADSLLFFQPRAPADYPRHVTAWHREQLAALKLVEPPLPLARKNPDGDVLIHPGSGGDQKCWPRERFISLGRTLKRNGIRPTFILGEVEQERWGRPLITELQGEFAWYLHMGLYELAERMSRARVYLGNDSGVTHLAAALGIPVLALFGPSNEVQWHPVGPAVKIVRAAVPREHSLEALEEYMVLGELLAELRKIP